jgi:DNA-binding NarL/FixJ family response regulator
MARLGLGQVVASRACLAGSVSTIQDAEYLPAATSVDVVLVGADVLDMDGTEGILRLLTRFLHARVVVLVADPSADLVVAMLRQGADGVLPRDIAPDGLRRALHGVIEHKVALPRPWVRFLTDALRLGPLTATVEDVPLSPRERDVLTEIALGRSNAEIALRLGLKASTVKTHVSNILSKAGARSRHTLSTRRPAAQDMA